jgi:hypothetical protein
MVLEDDEDDDDDDGSGWRPSNPASSNIWPSRAALRHQRRQCARYGRDAYRSAAEMPPPEPKPEPESAAAAAAEWLPTLSKAAAAPATPPAMATSW